VIGFATAVTDDSLYDRLALVGIQRVAERDSIVLVRKGLSLQRAYNEMLGEAAREDRLEALVLLHQDLLIDDEAFAAKLRRRLADESIAIVGAIGARGVRGIAWWDGDATFGRLRAQIDGGEVLVHGATPDGTHEVDAVDGSLLVLSSWAVRTLRFDERFANDLHGYDVDICFQARAHGKRVVVDELDALHASIGQVSERRGSWVRAAVRFDQKWGVPLASPAAYASWLAERRAAI
jgi:GT2 family glycosyltransferase